MNDAFKPVYLMLWYSRAERIVDVLKAIGNTPFDVWLKGSKLYCRLCDIKRKDE
jgi:hypothetical protein